jgi:hypothetical protein
MDRIEQLLRAAGWHPGRRVDTAADEQALTEAGFPVTPAAIAALREFSGLTVKRSDRSNGVLFGGVNAAQVAGSGWFERYNQAEGRVFTPIADYIPMMLMTDEAGGVWGGNEDDYGWLGGTVPEALDGTLFYDPAQPGLDRHVPLSPEFLAETKRINELVQETGRLRRAQRGWWRRRPDG